MNIKILSSLTIEAEKRNSTLIIGTHNGIFHSDEVLACAILCLANTDKSILILRSRDLEMLNTCDICVDIGGEEFDHHQAGFNKSRKNGIKYASAGLIWKAFGNELIFKFINQYFSNINFNINKIFDSFDESFISLVDCEDNGVSTSMHCFSFISSFLPLWFNNSSDSFNNQFYKVLNTTIMVLEEELKTFIGKEAAKTIITNNWNNKNYYNNGILEIPSQTLNWVDIVLSINESTMINYIDFVIFPYPNGGWAAQCVPPSFSNKFRQRISFPHNWAGQTDKLSEISGIDGATFCHNGRFFIRATSKEAIIKMCILARNSAD